MKCFLKKLVSTAFIALLTIGNMGFYTNVAGRYKENIDGYVLTAISEWNFENRKSRVAEIINLKGNSFNGEAIILDCGVYGNVFHNGKDRQYESHHLISNNFCNHHNQNYDDLITKDEAPSVLIPKVVHEKTGSYKKKDGDTYFIKEEECFAKDGMKGVLEYGINDLKRAFKECGFTDVGILEPNTIVTNKLYSYADLLDAIINKDISKIEIIKSKIITPLKGKTNLRLIGLCGQQEYTKPGKKRSREESRSDFDWLHKNLNNIDVNSINFPLTPMRPTKKAHTN